MSKKGDDASPGGCPLGPDCREPRALQDVCGRLKRIVADQAIQIQILREVNSKNGKLDKPTAAAPQPLDMPHARGIRRTTQVQKSGKLFPAI